MKKALVFIGILLCLSSQTHAGGDPKYPVHTIPDSLRKNVNAVVREDRSTYRIISKNKAKYSSYCAITIFNSKARDLAKLVLSYDKLMKISGLSAAVYDAMGNPIKKLKNSEIYDQSFDGGSLFSDDRLKAIDLTQGTFPYTVVFEYEIDYNGILHIHGSSLFPDEDISVERYSYELIYPAALAPRYKTFNIPTEPEKGKTTDGDEILSWKFNNVLPVKSEPFSPDDATFPQIVAAPTWFEYDGYAGNMATWNDYAKWIQSLNKGRNVLPDATREKIRTITAQAKTREEKVRIVYEYLQSKTRYVSIQLGIGGYQPFEASLVDQTGYGDCKALSNYMIAMLETIGVKGYYCLIGAGRHFSPLDVSFPSSQFNHVIVAVPDETDTLWLECTSQTNPFGYQGYHTGDRKALMITDDGAVVVNTTQYTAEQNLQSRTAEVVVETTGDASAKVVTTYSGLQYENGHLASVVNYEYDEQKKWLESNTDIPSFDLNSFSMKNIKTKVPSAVVSADLTLRRYASINGKRVFLTPNLMNRNTYIPEKVEARKTNVVNKIPSTDLDTIRYRLPEGLYPEYLPPPVKLQNRFGEYEASFKIDQGNLTYIRRLKMNKGEFPPESYSELIEFFRNISKADNTKVVLMNKT